MNKHTLRNRYGFGIGTIGRDSVYTMISMYLMFYLTDVLQVSTTTMWYVTGIIMATKAFDAINDPFMGVIVDNTHSRFGKFKPWIFGGAIVSSVFTILMFTDFQLSGAAFIFVFTFSYLLWEISFTANDIAYWSMLPALSKAQKERERIGAVARICANLGMFAMVIGIVPLTGWLSTIFNSLTTAYWVLSIAAVVVMLVFQMLMLVLVREEEVVVDAPVPTRFKDLVRIIFANDQLLWVTLSMALFMIGYSTTTSFGLYYFIYVFGNEDMYAIFALILGIAQISALLSFPYFSKKTNRKTLYLIATILVVLGYVVFFFAPNTTMLYIGIAGLLLFIGQAFIQLLMLMFITDTVEYGEWKLGQRNDSVTLSLQSFINKIGSSLASGIVGVTLIISGMKNAQSAADMSSEGLFIFKGAMLILPLIFIVIGYFIYRAKYTIDENRYQAILNELEERKQNS